MRRGREAIGKKQDLQGWEDGIMKRELSCLVQCGMI